MTLRIPDPHAVAESAMLPQIEAEPHDDDPVVATELGIDADEEAFGVVSGLRICYRRATIVILETATHDMQCGIFVAPHGRPRDREYECARARMNARARVRTAQDATPGRGRVSAKVRYRGEVR